MHVSLFVKYTRAVQHVVLVATAPVPVAGAAGAAWFICYIVGWSEGRLLGLAECRLSSIGTKRYAEGSMFLCQCL